MAPADDFLGFAVGDSASLERVVRAEDVTRFVEITGDNNPVHVDEQFAAAIGAGGRLVHGMLTASFVSTVIGTMLPGPGALWLSESFQFRAPVRIDDQIHVEVKVRHVSPATRVLVLDVTVRNQHQRVVLDGEAQVHVLDRLRAVTASEGTATTAVVTGAGRGIGSAIATRLAADGLRVVVNFRHDEVGAEKTVRAIQESGGEATSRMADVTDPESVASLIAYATDTYGPVNVLVNNAGSAIDPRPILETSWVNMERHLATHLRGSFLCVEATLPSMIEQGFGRIVNITSQSAYGAPPPKMAGYVVAKAALAAFTRCLAAEVGPQGLTVNAVAPGMVETDMVADVPQRAKMALAAQAPLRRLATAGDVADAVSYLVGSGAAYVTGQTIHLSGGQVMP